VARELTRRFRAALPPELAATVRDPARVERGLETEVEERLGTFWRDNRDQPNADDLNRMREDPHQLAAVLLHEAAADLTTILDHDDEQALRHELTEAVIGFLGFDPSVD